MHSITLHSIIQLSCHPEQCMTHLPLPETHHYQIFTDAFHYVTPLLLTERHDTMLISILVADFCLLSLMYKLLIPTLAVCVITKKKLDCIPESPFHSLLNFQKKCNELVEGKKKLHLVCYQQTK